MRRILAGITGTVATAAMLLATGTSATAKGGEIGGTGSWYFLSNSISPTAEITFNYGRADDEVYVGDWDGNGTDTVAVRRGNAFHVNNSATGGPADEVFYYGRTGDTVLVGDWNGDGRDTLAVRRGSQYHVKNSLRGGDADHVINYGRATDEVLVGDWDGDRRDTFAVRRGKTFHLKNSMRGGDADVVINFGRESDAALVGDWNGDGIDTLGLRRDSAPITPPAGPSPEAAAALAALDDIRVTTREAGGYDRSEFGSGWSTVNGCDTRNRVLARDLYNLIYRDDCIIESGTLDDPYTGQRIDFVRGVGTSNAVQIDHVVAVSSAWKMGANTWTYNERRAFYNDTDNLLAVDGPTNASKGDSTLGEWQPPNDDFHCDYAITYIEVTDDYDLALKPIDVTYAEELLPTC